MDSPRAEQAEVKVEEAEPETTEVGAAAGRKKKNKKKKSKTAEDAVMPEIAPPPMPPPMPLPPDVPDDPTMKKLMEDAFGPPSSETGDRVARGMETLSVLSSEESASAIKWLEESAEGLLADQLQEPRLCFHCGASPAASSCSRCGVAAYCGKDCQTADWGSKRGRWGGHKASCAKYKCLGKGQILSPSGRREATEAVLARLRLYLCPFALCHGSGGEEGKKPRGLVFLQFGCSLSALALPAPRDCSGRTLSSDERGAMLHFVSLEEFENEVAPSDAKIGALSAAVASAVAAHDDKAQVVVLARAACGYTALLLQPLVPAWNVAVALAREYVEQDCLQINLDDGL